MSASMIRKTWKFPAILFLIFMVIVLTSVGFSDGERIASGFDDTETNLRVGAFAILFLIVFCVGIWCGTGLGEYVTKNRVYLWLENGWIVDVEADDADRVDLIVIESNTDLAHKGETTYVWTPSRLTHAGRAAREAAKRS